MSEFALAWRLARRELRGSLDRLAVFLACLTLGVAAIAAVGVINAAVIAGLQRDASVLLGGDVEIRSSNFPISLAEREAMTPAGARGVPVIETNAMVYDDQTGERIVSELKAVGDAYPLYGEVTLDPPMPLSEALRDGGVVAEAGLLTRLGLEVGDPLRIGDATFVLRAVLVREPDRLGGFITIGPRTLIAEGRLAATGAIQPGSLARYHYRMALPAGLGSAATIADIEAAFPEASWRIRGRADVEPSFSRFTGRLASYLTIAGLTALLIGGVGVALAIQNYLGGKTTTIATLKCLGARSGLVFRTYLLQVLAITTAGVLVGLALGQTAPWLLRFLPPDVLPVPYIEGVYPIPLLVAAACGYLAALTFTLWPLARARDVSAAGIFRSLIVPSSRWPARRDLFALAGCLVAFAILAVIGVGDPVLGGAFIGFMAVGALVLALLAHFVLKGVARFGTGRSATLRLALANLDRPGSGTAGVAVALGAGLAVLSMVALLRVNLATELAERLPERAPAFFFIDIQPDQVERFREITTAEGVTILDEAPMLRGRMVRIDGQPVDEEAVDPDVRWTVRSDRGLTYRSAPPDGVELVRGAWWPEDYDGPPLVSIDEQLATGYGVDVGDTLAFNVLGRIVEAEIASSRTVEWESVGMNWLFIMSPGVLEAAPHTWIATIESPPSADARLVSAVAEDLPNVTPISVREIVGQLAEAFGKIAVAVSAVGALTLLSGILVLAGAIAAARRRHLYEAVVLKVLGARRFALMKVFLLEYLALGLVAGVAGAMLGTIGAWVVVVLVMDLPWTFSPAALLQVVGLALAVTFGAGFLGTWRLLGRPAAPVLRTA